LQKLRRRDAGPLTGALERLGPGSVAVGLVEKLVEDRPHLFGQLALHEALAPLLDLQLALLALLDSGESSAQRLGRGRAIASAAFAIEVHRRRVQLEQDGRGLRGRRLLAVVVAR